MCHVVSSNSYKNLPVDRWIHTTGEKRLEFVVSERRNDRSTNFSPLGFTHKLYHCSLEMFPESWASWSSGFLRRSCQMWMYEVVRGGWATVFMSVDRWSDEQTWDYIFPRASFETFIQWEWKERRWAHSQNMILEKKERRAPFSSTLTERFLRLTEHRQSD